DRRRQRHPPGRSLIDADRLHPALLLVVPVGITSDERRRSLAVLHADDDQVEGWSSRRPILAAPEKGTEFLLVRSGGLFGVLFPPDAVDVLGGQSDELQQRLLVRPVVAARVARRDTTFVALEQVDSFPIDPPELGFLGQEG